MSGGQLVVLDRLGRDIKRYPLPEGLATLGSDPACDIRVMLPSVSAHHATVVVHANQTVVRNVSDGETLVNGQGASVAALRHGDIITIGGRALRWEYSQPATRRLHRAPTDTDAVFRGAGGVSATRATRAARRATGGPAPRALAREPALRLALELTHRASMPGGAGGAGGAGGKQVAIVQPQRRDTNEQNDKTPPRTPVQPNKRRSKNDLDTNDSEADSIQRRPTTRTSPKNVSNLQTTKATLWIESRKPRAAGAGRRSVPAAKKSTPLRLTVLKRAQSAQKLRVMKIEAPLKIDHTKQAAIMLMTGHTPKSRLPSPKNAKNTPSYVVKKPSPVRKTPGGRGRKSAARRSKEVAAAASLGVTPKRSSTHPNTSRRTSKRLGDQTVSILEITDSDAQHSTARASNVSRTCSRRSGNKSPQKSPLLPSPKKSALKDPKAKKSMRKTESIKFDLSNLENHTQSIDVLMLTDTTKKSYNGDSASEDDLTLHYSDSSSVLSPSPRRSIHSRSSRMLEKSLGTTVTISPPSRTLTPESPRTRKSGRGSIILQKALDQSNDSQTTSRRSMKSLSNRSESINNGSAYRTHTLSPRSPSRNELESYSIVDLVSIDSNETGRSTSVYNSAGSTTSSAFGTPKNSLGRKTRSTINPTLLGSSTPYVRGNKSLTRSQSTPNTSTGATNLSQVTARSSGSTRRSKSLSTPENSEDTKKHISVNSTKISRASKSRSRLNDSDLLIVEGEDNDDSPKSSKRSRGQSNQNTPDHNSSKNASSIDSPTQDDGTITPENRCSPDEATTPVLSIQSLLDSSHISFASYKSEKRSTRSGPSYIIKRKTTGGISESKAQAGTKSKSMSFTARKTRLRLSSDSVQGFDECMQTDDEAITPKSAVKLVPEGVKNKHSTAKKPQSKRSIIDDLNQSDIVKQLFNSPVKRKLSQSMTEFSRKQLFDDDDDHVVLVKRTARNTIALTGRTPDNSLLENTESFTPDRFVSPIHTPSNSPNLDGIKRLFDKNTPSNDLRNVKGVKRILKTPRTRRSIKNDLTDVAGVKLVFAKSPRNRLSDVRVKEVFASSPKNDLRRVSGVKSLFHTQTKAKSPNNDLRDVRGVKNLFRSNKSPRNDLQNVYGVKRTMRRNSPTNDLTDVRGVKRMFREEREDNINNGLTDISGVEELFNISNQSRDTDSLFDRLLGRPPIKAIYSKTFSTRIAPKATTNRKSLQASIGLITNNVEQWLEQELQKRLHKNETSTSKLANRSKLSLTRELQKLATSTVEGTTPLRNSRVRTSTLIRSIQADAPERKKSASELYSAHTLPIKKRSLIDKSADKVENVSKVTLPIKKRVVIHSTPVKGRVNMTMNASELGRVSPIAAIDKTANNEHYFSLRSNNQQAEPTGKTKAKKDVSYGPTTSTELTEPSSKKTRAKSKLTTTPKAKTSPVKSRSKRQTRAKVVKSISADSAKVNFTGKSRLAATSSSKPKSPSPVKARATRSRKHTATPETNGKKQRTSLVVAKKTPIMSPKPRATRTKKVVSPKVTPKNARATRKNNNVAEKVKTPKNTRTKIQKASVVVSKPSPALKPKTAKKDAVSKRTRKAESPVESLETIRAVNAPKTRGRRAEVAKQALIENEPNATRGRRTKAEAKSEEKSVIKIAKTTRGKKLVAQASVQSEPSTRSRRNPEVPTKTRKRKTVSDDTVPTKVAKSKEIVESKGRKKTVQTTETETANGRQKRSVVKDSKVEITRQGSGDGNKTTRVVRSKKIVEVTKTESEPKKRGRKTANVVESEPEVGKRKRKITVEPSPVKEASRKQPGGKKSRKVAEVATPPTKATRTRSTRAKNASSEASEQLAGRTRRR